MAKPKKQTSTKPKTLLDKVKKPFVALRRRVGGLLKRRPHRSFRRTRRRDYVRSLKLPGHWAFTHFVWKTLWQHRKLFSLLMVVYAVITIGLVGIASQDTYSQLNTEIKKTGDELLTGNWGQLGQAGLLLMTGVTGGINDTMTEPQQIYAAIILLFTWLTTVWLLRALLAGKHPRLRDGLYHAGAPMLSTVLVGLVAIIQLLPLAIAVIAYAAAAATGLLDKGVEAMLFWVAAGLLALLSLYWLTSTFIALVVVTLPGMYPMHALRTAGDLVVGRRLRILLRILWLLLGIAIAWIVVLVPIILFDTWLKSLLPAIQWVPVVPVALLAMGTLTVIWAASYIYLLYRRIVDDDAAPA